MFKQDLIKYKCVLEILH